MALVAILGSEMQCTVDDCRPEPERLELTTRSSFHCDTDLTDCARHEEGFARLGPRWGRRGAMEDDGEVCKEDGMGGASCV